LGIAKALAAAGSNIVLNGFGDRDGIETTRSEISREHNVAAIYSNADISKPDAIAGMVEEAERELGAVDILVNNAGIQHVPPIEWCPPEKWDLILAINLSGAFHASRLVVPQMKQRGWGRIVNIASAHALVASPYKSAYVAAKHGIAGLTKTIALEL